MTFGKPTKNWGCYPIKPIVSVDVKNLRVFTKDYDGVIPFQGELDEYTDENVEDRFSPHSEWIELPGVIKVFINPTNIGQVVIMNNQQEI